MRDRTACAMSRALREFQRQIFIFFPVTIFLFFRNNFYFLAFLAYFFQWICMPYVSRSLAPISSIIRIGGKLSSTMPTCATQTSHRFAIS